MSLSDYLTVSNILTGVFLAVCTWLLVVKLTNVSKQRAIDQIGYKLIDDIENLCRELASPSDHRRYVKTDLPQEADVDNYLRKHVEVYLQQRVTKYISDAYYNDRSIGKIRFKVKVSVTPVSRMGNTIQISFKLGFGFFSDYITYFKASPYAHASMFFQKEILSK
jgi:hypothetical protein